jgi:hypothetical protein
MRVILFQDHFAAMVRAGTKHQTIRKTARCRPRDVLSLLRWTGQPYRSKQEILREAVCSAVTPIEIERWGVSGVADDDKMARLDGFADWLEMRAWFDGTHGLPFAGWLIEWQSAPAEARCKASHPAGCSARPWLGRRVVSLGEVAGWEDGAAGIVAEAEGRSLDDGWFDMVYDDGRRCLAHTQEFQPPNKELSRE